MANKNEIMLPYSPQHAYLINYRSVDFDGSICVNSQYYSGKHTGEHMVLLSSTKKATITVHVTKIPMVEVLVKNTNNFFIVKTFIGNSFIVKGIPNTELGKKLYG